MPLVSPKRNSVSHLDSGVPWCALVRLAKIPLITPNPIEKSHLYSSEILSRSLSRLCTGPKDNSSDEIMSNARAVNQA